MIRGRWGGGLLGMRYNIGGDYVFPLGDAAYRTLVIFVYIVITLSAYQLVPRKRPFASRIDF